jgi:hypothetical protein
VKDVAEFERCQRRDQSRYEPKAQDQRHRHVDDDVDLQAAKIGDVDSAGGAGGDREYAVGRNPADKAGDHHQTVANRRQQVQDPLLVPYIDQSEAEQDAEDDDRRNDCIG